MALTEEEKAKIIEEEKLRKKIRKSGISKTLNIIGISLLVLMLPLIVSAFNYYVMQDKETVRECQGLLAFEPMVKGLAGSRGENIDDKYDNALSKCTLYQQLFWKSL